MVCMTFLYDARSTSYFRLKGNHNVRVYAVTVGRSDSKPSSNERARRDLQESLLQLYQCDAPFLRYSPLKNVSFRLHCALSVNRDHVSLL